MKPYRVPLLLSIAAISGLFAMLVGEGPLDAVGLSLVLVPVGAVVFVTARPRASR
ncbi:MAG: hypothetical protein QM756_06555 [Polyangiaceae bacterium]